MNETRLTGGCQCGAVRFRVERLGRGSICHCRMCQKAFGNFYAPLISGFGVVWTRGKPAYFQSSNKVRRGFCAACGTPLTYELLGRSEEDEVEVAIAAFDDPRLTAPSIQVNPGDKLPFVDDLPKLHTRTDAEDQGQAAFNASIVSYQHPDHDTAAWPPAGGFGG
jgi:hypothetical protein